MDDDENYAEELGFDCTDVSAQNGISITLRIEDSSENVSTCETTVTVHYYLDNVPAPLVVLDPANGEICSEGTAIITLTNANFGTVTDWTWTVTAPAAITPNTGLNGTNNGDHTITQPFTNATDAVDTVIYTFTPRIYGLCQLQTIKDTVFVNPHPKLLDISNATICNKSDTPIPVRTNSRVSEHAVIRYQWAVSNNTNVTGQSSSGINEYAEVNESSSVTQTLDNHSLSDQDVTYTLSPSLHLNGRICSSPNEKSVTVTVMPTPVIRVTASMDTICNRQPIHFEVESDNQLSSKGKWLSNLNLVPEDANISVSSPNVPLPQNTIFNQTIANAARGKRTVSYAFDPKIQIASNTYCPSIKDTTIIIAVNPTPQMLIGNFRDSICYMDDTPKIPLFSNNTDVLGTLRYNLWKVDDPANTLLGNVIGMDDFTRHEELDGWDATTRTTATKNGTDTEQMITCSIYPFIEYGSLHCSGDSVKQNIHLAPELKFDMVSPTVLGGYHIRCYGYSDGKIEIENVTGGWSAEGYRYEWTDATAGDTPIIADRPAGVYGVTVFDRALGCKTSKQFELTQPLELKFSQTHHDPSCHGPTGDISVVSSGGTKPYRYDWFAEGLLNKEDVDISSMMNLYSGVYQVTVKDANQCKYSQKIELLYYSGNTTFKPIWTSDKYYRPDVSGVKYDISCNGANDGMIVVNPDNKYASAYFWLYNGEIFKHDTISPGNPPFHFNLFNGGDFVLSNLGPGEYDLIIIDTIGCVYTSLDKFPMIEPVGITFDASVFKYENDYEVKCYGAKDGRIEISNVSGAYGEAYQYNWSALSGDPGDIVPNSPVQQKLGAGTYQLAVASEYHGSRNGSAVMGFCKKTTVFTLDQPPELVAKETISDFNGYQIQCFGDHTGAISLDVSGGGKGAYSYLWSTKDGSGLKPQNQNQKGLSAGAYSVIIGYSNGLCADTVQYVLTSPLRMQNDSIISAIKCYGDNNASISVNMSGGVPEYDYLWGSPDATIENPLDKDQSGLKPGVYELTVTDRNNCVKSETYRLTEPDPINPNLVAEDMSCDPGNDGYIIANPSGGTPFDETPKYRYLWRHDHSTTSEINGLVEGTYAVTVSDANGCTAEDSAKIHIPSALKVTAMAETNFNGYQIDCYNHNSGKIALDVQNSRRDLVYQWSSGDTTAGIDQATAGNYSVTVTDYFNCKGSASITLTQPNPIWGQFAVTDVVCPGDNTGKIQALIGGGVPPYHYHWARTAEDTLYLDRLTAGTYQLQVVDRNNCYLNNLQATVTQPPAFNINFLVTDPFCPETYDGEIWAKVSGGTPPYTYRWTDAKSTTIQGITDLKTGIYSLEITDAANCTHSQTVELGVVSQECLYIPNAFSPNSDGSNDVWEISVGSAGMFTQYRIRDLFHEATVEVWDGNWGLLLYRSQKGYPEPWDGKYRGKYLPVKSYQYIIRLNSQIKPITGNVTIVR